MADLPNESKNWLHRMVEVKQRETKCLAKHIASLPPLPGASVPVRDMFNDEQDNEECSHLTLGHSQLFPVANLIAVKAAKEFSANEIICHYFGWVVTHAEFECFTDVERSDIHCNTAVRYMGNYTLIGYPNRVGSLINDPRRGLHPLQANCTFSTSVSDGIRVKATKRIAVGEELLLSYGQDYWSRQNHIYCYICLGRKSRRSDPILHCSGVHRRENQLVKCCLAAHCSCLNAPATQQRFKCYVCAASDSGWMGSSSDALTTRKETVASCLSGSLSLPIATLLPATLPASGLVTYCFSRIFDGIGWGFDQVKRRKHLVIY